MILEELDRYARVHVPPVVLGGTQYLTQMGSIAYGTARGSSDVDLYGFCIPARDTVFPHLAGYVPGFGKAPPSFEQWQHHHISDPLNGREYDITVYGIVKYFALVMANNPNMVDSLFVPRECIVHITPIGERVREERKLFLHKGCWAKFKGYSYSQLHKMANKRPVGKRRELVEAHGYDVKFATHTMRLLLEVEQILTEGDLDLRRHREQLKSVRRGEWTEKQIREWASDKERQLEEAHTKSDLPAAPDEDAIKALLLECLEMYYGSLGGAVALPGAAEKALEEIGGVVQRYNREACA